MKFFFTSASVTVAALLASSVAVVKADTECHRKTTTFENEKFNHFLSLDGNHPFVNNYITKGMVEGTEAFQFHFGRVREVECLVKQEDPNAACPDPSHECVSFQHYMKSNWYMAGAFGYRLTPQFYDPDGSLFVAEVPSRAQLSWCKMPGLTGTPGTVSLENYATHKYLVGATYQLKMVWNTHALVDAGGASWFPHADVCCDGADILCGDHLGERVAGANGDPHVRTWNGKHFDFMGACDLVLVQNSKFADGLGMNIHIRTKLETWWSYIEAAAVQIGNDVLEIMGGRDGTVKYWMNHGEMTELADLQTKLGDSDYHVEFHRINANQGRASIDLGNDNAIILGTYKQFVKVHMVAKNGTSFDGSVGLMGTYPDGKLMARNQTTRIVDPDELGQEWQVLPQEPMLFHSAPTWPKAKSAMGLVMDKIHLLTGSSGSQQQSMHPNQCTMPEKTRTGEDWAADRAAMKASVAGRRRLGEARATMTKEEATAACAHVAFEDMKDCINDVMSTGDKDMAASYAPDN